MEAECCIKVWENGQLYADDVFLSLLDLLAMRMVTQACEFQWLCVSGYIELNLQIAAQ